MTPLMVFLLMQILYCGQISVYADKSLRKFIDSIEKNEHKIHEGIASGRYDAEDQKASKTQEVDEDDYGKMLFDDMANFRKVQIPGVDYNMEPESVPIPYNFPVEEEEEEEEEEPIPPPHHSSHSNQDQHNHQKDESEGMPRHPPLYNYPQSPPEQPSAQYSDGPPQTDQQSPPYENQRPPGEQQSPQYDDRNSPPERPFPPYEEQAPPPDQQSLPYGNQGSSQEQQSPPYEDQSPPPEQQLLPYGNQGSSQEPQSPPYEDQPQPPEQQLLTYGNQGTSQDQQLPLYDDQSSPPPPQDQQISPYNDHQSREPESPAYGYRSPPAEPQFAPYADQPIPNEPQSVDRQDQQMARNESPPPYEYSEGAQPPDSRDALKFYYPQLSADKSNSQNDGHIQNSQSLIPKTIHDSDPGVQYSAAFRDPLNKPINTYHETIKFNENLSPEQKAFIRQLPPDYQSSHLTNGAYNDDNNQMMLLHQNDKNLFNKHNLKPEIYTIGNRGQIQYNGGPKDEQNLKLGLNQDQSITNAFAPELLFYDNTPEMPHSDGNMLSQPLSPPLSPLNPLQLSPSGNVGKVLPENNSKFLSDNNEKQLQMTDENKLITKRIGSSPSHHHRTPHRKNYGPPNNYNKPTVGSREYSKSQKYTSYTPIEDDSPPEESFPKDEEEEAKSYYDRWAEEQKKYAENDKYKSLEDDVEQEMPKEDHFQNNSPDQQYEAPDEPNYQTEEQPYGEPHQHNREQNNRNQQPDNHSQQSGNHDQQHHFNDAHHHSGDPPKHEVNAHLQQTDPNEHPRSAPQHTPDPNQYTEDPQYSTNPNQYNSDSQQYTDNPYQHTTDPQHYTDNPHQHSADPQHYPNSAHQHSADPQQYTENLHQHPADAHSNYNPNENADYHSKDYQHNGDVPQYDPHHHTQHSAQQLPQHEEPYYDHKHNYNENYDRKPEQYEHQNEGNARYEDANKNSHFTQKYPNNEQQYQLSDDHHHDNHNHPESHQYQHPSHDTYQDQYQPQQQTPLQEEPQPKADPYLKQYQEKAEPFKNDYQPQQEPYSYQGEYQQKYNHQQQHQDFQQYPQSDPFDGPQQKDPQTEYRPKYERTGQLRNAQKYSPVNQLRLDSDSNDNGKDHNTEKPIEVIHFDFQNKQSFDDRVANGKLGTFSKLPFNFESLIQADTSFLDALTPPTPHNYTGLEADDPDSGYQTNAELTTHTPFFYQSSPYKGNNGNPHSHSRPQKDQYYDHQHDARYNNDGTDVNDQQNEGHTQLYTEQYPANDQYSQNAYYSRPKPKNMARPTHPTLYEEQPNHKPVHERQRYAHYDNNQYSGHPNMNQHRHQHRHQHRNQQNYRHQPQHYSVASREPYFDDQVTAAAADSLAKKKPTNAVLTSEESRKVSFKFNTTEDTINNINNNNYNRTDELITAQTNLAHTQNVISNNNETLVFKTLDPTNSTRSTAYNRQKRIRYPQRAIRLLSNSTQSESQMVRNTAKLDSTPINITKIIRLRNFNRNRFLRSEKHNNKIITINNDNNHDNNSSSITASIDANSLKGKAGNIRTLPQSPIHFDH